MTSDIKRFANTPTNIISLTVGAIVGFLLPDMHTSLPQHHGVVATIIAFELSYINLITTAGLLLLIYWLFVRRKRGRETPIMYGALGFAFVRLVVAVLKYVNGRH